MSALKCNESSSLYPFHRESASRHFLQNSRNLLCRHPAAIRIRAGFSRSVSTWTSCASRKPPFLEVPFLRQCRGGTSYSCHLFRTSTVSAERRLDAVGAGMATYYFPQNANGPKAQLVRREQPNRVSSPFSFHRDKSALSTPASLRARSRTERPRTDRTPGGKQSSVTLEIGLPVRFPR